MKWLLLPAVFAVVFLQLHARILVMKEQVTMLDDQKVTEEIKFDMDKDQQIISIVDSDDITKGDVTVLDYRKDLTAMFYPDANECYLIVGLDSEQKDTDEPSDVDEEDEVTEKIVENILEKVDGVPIKDLSAVPESVRPLCKDKDTYWMKKAENDGIQKRGCKYERHCNTYCCKKRWWSCKKRCVVCNTTNKCN